MITKLLKNLLQLTSFLNTGADTKEALRFIYNSFHEFLPYTMIGVVLRNSIENNFSKICVCAEDKPCNYKCISFLETDTVEEVIANNKVSIMNNYDEYLKNHWNSENIKILRAEGYNSSLAVPLIVNDICFGALVFFNNEANSFNINYITIAKILANCISISIEKNILADELMFTSIIGFAKLVEARDNDTGEHLERIQDYSRIIAENLISMRKYTKLIDDNYISDIYKFSSLHDIGKVAIPDSILLKPGKLTAEEFDIMKTHTAIGANILRKSSNHLIRGGKNYWGMAIDIAQNHHERYDGTGYPNNLKGNYIPLSARIVTVADVLDALSSKRVYKEAFSISDSLNMILMQKGSAFDPDIVDALVNGTKEIIQTYNANNKSK